MVEINRKMAGDWRKPMGALVAAMALAMATGCGLNDAPQSNLQLEEDLEVKVQELKPFCSVDVEGHGAVDVESDYLPSVVACENGNAPMEALKAQAVAARTYAMFQAEAGAEPLAPTTDDQVYGCDYAEVEQRHIDAVEATEGQVLTRNDDLIAAFYVAGAILVFLNGWLDLVDGALARREGIASDGGDFLDHVLDRYADIVVIAGFTVGVDAYALGFLAVTGVLMTSYLGTQIQAVGIGREYGGLVGRADRLALMGVVGGVAAIHAAPIVAGLSVVELLLAVLAVVGHLTALQRFRGAWADL